MERNINEAFDEYSGERPLGLFVDKLEKNLTKLNEIFAELTDLFVAAGIPDFSSLPEEKAEKGKFAKLFREFNAHLEAAIIQDFKWDKKEYTFEHEDGNKTTVTVGFTQTQYLILAMRYKELFSSHTGTGDDDVPYDVDTHLTEINTGAIDKDYLQNRFKKFLKALQEGEETSGVLDELHRSFAVLGKEEQKYADMILVDIQSGNLTIEEGKTLSDYIVEYMSKAHNDRIHRFAQALGMDEAALREFMARRVTPENINEYLETSLLTGVQYDCFPYVELFDLYDKEEIRRDYLTIIHNLLFSRIKSLGSIGYWYLMGGNIPDFLNKFEIDINWEKLYEIFEFFLQISLIKT